MNVFLNKHILLNKRFIFLPFHLMPTESAANELYRRLHFGGYSGTGPRIAISHDLSMPYHQCGGKYAWLPFDFVRLLRFICGNSLRPPSQH